MAQARTLVEVGGASGPERAGRADHSHWTERAQALLAPLLHAGAVSGADMGTVLTWVDRRQALPAQQILAGELGGATMLARNLLDGIVSTDERELSGIWSTASGSLAGFRSESALAVMARPDFDPVGFVRSTDTIYISAPAHLQSQVAPMVVGLVDDIRRAAYALRADGPETVGSGPPVLFALDELANIAPIPDLPSMISEGGGQGVVTLACLQDLTQARSRWPVHADGFPSLFGSTVVLPGIGDVRTLDALSTLAGEVEIATHTRSWGQSASGRPATDMVTGGRPQYGAGVSTQFRRRLPVDVIARGTPDHGLAFDERNRAGWLRLAASHRDEPWRSLRHLSHGRDRRLEPKARGDDSRGWAR